MKESKEQEIKKILTRGVEEVIVKSHLEKVLKSGKKLRVKLGIDPTAPDLHLGHTVPLIKLGQFQKAGHKIILIIGDFTATIGDPSGRTEARKPLLEKQVKSNMKKYVGYAGKIIDIKKTEIRYNSEWLKKGGIRLFLELVKGASVQQILKREDFKKRLALGNDVSVLESLYPLFQGYDSVAVKADVEIGGRDQKLNLLMGRRVQRSFGMSEQDIMTFPLIEGTDGVRKMSKSYGNYVALDEKPGEMFGKIMSIPDSLTKTYFENLTDVDAPKGFGPYKSKLLLAETIVGMYHSAPTAKKAREEFIRVFSKKELPRELPSLKIKNKKPDILELLVKAGVPSKNEARRLVLQGGVKINGETKNNPNEKTAFRGGEVLRIGKHRFFKIVI
ncbi:MAG: tyrosine--tRNA ligase [Candidatus Jorgensenbacteria bacterium]